MRSQKCRRGKPSNIVLRCGRTTYDVTTHFCANRRLFARTDYGICRGYVLRRVAVKSIG